MYIYMRLLDPCPVFLRQSSANNGATKSPRDCAKTSLWRCPLQRNLSQPSPQRLGTWSVTTWCPWRSSTGLFRKKKANRRYPSLLKRSYMVYTKYIYVYIYIHIIKPFVASYKSNLKYESPKGLPQQKQKQTKHNVKAKKCMATIHSVSLTSMAFCGSPATNPGRLGGEEGTWTNAMRCKDASGEHPRART